MAEIGSQYVRFARIAHFRWRDCEACKVACFSALNRSVSSRVRLPGGQTVHEPERTSGSTEAAIAER